MRPLLLVLLAILATEHLLQAQNIQMTGSLNQILANGGRVSWSVNNVIAYDHQGGPSPGVTGYFNVYTMTPSGGSQTCITCPTSTGVPSPSWLNAGTPIWSPDGNFLLFQAQALPSLGNYTNDFHGFPGEGANNDWWATDTLGHFWQLTNQGRWGASGILVAGFVTTLTDSLSSSGTFTTTGGGCATPGSGTFTESGGDLVSITIAPGGSGSGCTSNPTFVPCGGCGSLGASTVAFIGSGGVIYHAFSWDGTKFSWGQRLTPGTPPASPGVWEIAIATFSETGGVPSLSSTQYYQPYQAGGTPGYYEPHTFSLDNSTVFFMGDKETPGMNTYARNIYSYNPSTSTLVNLTKTLANWNEYPLALPAVYGSNKIIYMIYPDAGSGNTNCISDYWVMNYDGTDNYQLTFFNTPGSPNYQSPQAVCMDDHSFSPSGAQMIGFANYFAANGHTGIPGPAWILNIADVAVVNAVSSGAFPGSGFYPGSGLQ